MRKSGRGGQAKALGWKAGGVGCLIICMVCIMIASLMIYSTFWYPANMRRVADDWVETPCVIEKCVFDLPQQVSTRSRAMNILEVEYTYEVAGESFTSDRVDFVLAQVGSMSIEGEDYVRDFPAGSETVCYVNPENPADAVLLPSRAASATFWLVPIGYLSVGLLPIMLAGIIGFFWWRIGRAVDAKQRHH